jgi:type I restriction enzyme, S subunit
VKDAAGPNDYPHLKRVEHRARLAGFFDFHRVKGARYRVRKYRHFEELIGRTREKLGDRSREVDSLLQLMLPMDTQQAEIVCTVYAAWNNLLLDRQQITDEGIVLEARENWHPDKLKIPREQFFAAIEWLRKEGIVPVGKGKKVTAKACKQ